MPGKRCCFFAVTLYCATCKPKQIHLKHGCLRCNISEDSKLAAIISVNPVIIFIFRSHLMALHLPLKQQLRAFLITSVLLITTCLAWACSTAFRALFSQTGSSSQ